MRNVKELLDEAIYAGNLSENEEEKLYSWIESLILAKRKAEEYEAKAKVYNDTLKTLDKLINDDERYKEARSNDFVAGMLIAYENIFNLMEDYNKEGCEYDVKK